MHCILQWGVLLHYVFAGTKIVNFTSNFTFVLENQTGLLLMQTDFISNYCTKLSCVLLHVSATYFSCKQEATIKNTNNISYVSKYPFADIRYAACFFIIL